MITSKEIVLAAETNGCRILELNTGDPTCQHQCSGCPVWQSYASSWDRKSTLSLAVDSALSNFKLFVGKFTVPFIAIVQWLNQHRLV